MINHTHDVTIGGQFVTQHCKEFDHVTFYVSSPKVVALHLIKCYGFTKYAIMGLETGCRNTSAIAVRNGHVVMVMKGALRPLHSTPEDPLVDDIHRHVATHGDAVSDVAFQVDDIVTAIKLARNGGATILEEPHEFTDEFGTIVIAKVAGLNDVVHTFINRGNYTGFLPGFKLEAVDQKVKPSLCLDAIDHCVQNEDWNQMEKACDYYKKAFGFHVFWSVDDKQVYTEYSALKSTVMASPAEHIKMPINEPANGLKKSQIEEFIEFNHGSGIQHIAIRTNNIIDCVKKMREMGVDFIDVPPEYYTNLEMRFKKEKHPKIKETIKMVKKCGILVDFDEKGYLLQLFTRPLFDRPTFFFEIIQRHNHDGFGAGNFKGLFEVLEKDQEKRGNLTEQNVRDRTKGLVYSQISHNPDVEITDEDISFAVNYKG